MVPKWKREVSDIDSSYNIYTDYFISGGYWASITKNQTWNDIAGRNYKAGNVFKKSSEYWTYGGKKFNVLYGDSFWKWNARSQLRTNHTVKGVSTKYFLDAPNSSSWVESFFYRDCADDDEALDYAKNIKSNYVFGDGSAKGIKGDDNAMVEMFHRRGTDYSFFIPHK